MPDPFEHALGLAAWRLLRQQEGRWLGPKTPGTLADLVLCRSGLDFERYDWRRFEPLVAALRRA